MGLIRTNIGSVSFEFRFRIPSFPSAVGFPPSLLISWATAFRTPGNLYLARKYSIWKFFRLIYERYAIDGPFVSEVDFQIKLLRYSLLKYIYIFCGGTVYPTSGTVVQWYRVPHICEAHIRSGSGGPLASGASHANGPLCKQGLLEHTGINKNKHRGKTYKN